MQISLIIPCYNEEKNIPLIINKLYPLYQDKSFEIIFVENGSNDNSLSILKSYESKIPNFNFISIKKNKGYGYGIVQGLKIAKGQFLAWTHADMQTNPLDILKGMRLIKGEQKKIFIKGLRKGRKISDSFFTFGMSLFATFNLGYFLWDINAQPCIFPSSFFEDWIDPPNDFSLDLYAYFQAKRKGYQIKRFDVNFGKRIFGVSKWNFNLYSKIKFIKRNLLYIVELSNRYKKWK